MQRPPHDAIDLALDNCFDAVFAPELWEGAMDALTRSLGATGSCFNRFAGANRFKLPASPRYRDMLGEFIGGGWQSQDLRASRGWRQAKAGKPIVFESDCTSAQERKSLPIYGELFARHDMQLFAGVCLPVDDSLWTLTIARPQAMGGFETGDVEPILYARPSLRRLLRFAGSFSTAATQGAMSAFAQANIAAVLLDANGHVMEINPAALPLLGDGLDIRGRRLMAARPACNTALQALIHNAVSGPGVHEPVYIQRPGRTPLIVEATPLANARAEIFGLAGTTLLITDPERRAQPRPDMLRRAFGLTPREAEVGHLLTLGCDPNEIGERLILKRASVQQLIKALLAKTGTRRQSALVALFSRLPG